MFAVAFRRSVRKLEVIKNVRKCVCVKVNILAHPIPPNVFRRIKTTYEKVRRDQECA